MNPMQRPTWLVSLVACVALFGGLAPLPAQEQTPPAQDPLAPPPPSLAMAAAQEAQLDLAGALDTYDALLQTAVDALHEARQPSTPEAAADPVRAAQLLAEIEWLTIHFLETADALGDRTEAVDRLSRLSLTAATDGLAWARLQQQQPDRQQRLSLLTAWQFLGPFDNERGAAFQQQLSAELTPAPGEVHQGAEREITWRSLPQALPADGVLDFGRLLRPAQQSALLVRAWIQSPQDQEALLLLGIDGEVRVWHDGAAIYEADGRHQLRLDGLAAPLTLHAGWNEITLKLGSRDHSPRLLARLVDATTLAPLTLSMQATLPDGLVAAPLSGAAAPQEELLAPGARGYYLATTLVAPEDAQAWLRLGELEAAYQTEPKAQHPGRKALRKAADLAPQDAAIALALASELFPGLGANPAEIDLNPWLQQADAAEALSGPHGMVASHRILAVARFQQLEQRSRELADALVQSTKHAPIALYLRATIEDSFKQDALADRDRRLLLAHPDLHAYPLLEAAAAEILPEGSPLQIQHLERSYARTDSANTARRLLHLRALLRERTDLEDLEQDLAAELALDPWNAGIYREYAQRFQQRGALPRAFALVDQALAMRPDGPHSYALLARLHLQAGDTDSAVEALEQELERDYGNSDEQRLVDYLRQQDDATFDQPYREDLAAIIERHPAPAAEEGVSGAAYEYLLVRNVVRVHPDATADRYFRQVIRVLEPSAARSLDRRYLPYAWGDQDLRLLTARVQHEDGTDATARTDRGPRARIVDLPELHVGDVIDLEWRIDDLRPGIFGRYFGLDQPLAPETDVPVHESQVVVLEPKELPLQFHGIKLDGAVAETGDAGEFGIRHSWLVHDLQPRQPEPFMPPLEETAPRVQASSYASWEDFGQWWWQLIEPGITVSPEMRTEVARLTDGLENRQQQVDAIYDFVANDIRYNAWEFGIHGYQPYAAPVIFSRRFGDCKDKAILLRAMLSEIDVEAWPVLIRRVADGQHGGLRYQEDLSLALVSDFNHCIAWIPAQEGVEEGFVDGTARLHPRANLPYDDRGAEVLVVRADGVQRTRIPDAPAAANQRRTTAMVTLAADGSADIEITLSGIGRFDPELRQAFSGGHEEHVQIAEGLLGSLFGPVDEGVTIEVSDIEDMTIPVSVTTRGHAQRFARPVEGGLELPTTIMQRHLLSANGLAGLEKRASDLLRQSATMEKLQWMVVLPEGWTLDTPAPTISQDSEGLARYHWQLDPMADGFVIAEELDLLPLRITPEDYPRLREFARVVDRSQGASLTLLAPLSPTEDLQAVDSSSPPDAGKPSEGDGQQEDQQ